MNFKSFASIFMFGIATFLVVMIGCEHIQNEIVREKGPSSKDLVGSWELVSIDGEPFEESLFGAIKDFGEEFAAEVLANEYIFADNGSWSTSTKAKAQFDAEGLMTWEMISSASGTYVASDSSLTLVYEEVVLKILLEPKKIWELWGMTEQDTVLNPVEDNRRDYTWILRGDMLTITEKGKAAEDDRVTVLKRK